MEVFGGRNPTLIGLAKSGFCRVTRKATSPDVSAQMEKLKEEGLRNDLSSHFLVNFSFIIMSTLFSHQSRHTVSLDEVPVAKDDPAEKANRTKK